jgi:hypothetical protein
LETYATETGGEGHDSATLRRPESFPGQRSAQFLAASRTPQDYGLIII